MDDISPHTLQITFTQSHTADGCLFVRVILCFVRFHHLVSRVAILTWQTLGVARLALFLKSEAPSAPPFPFQSHEPQCAIYTKHNTCFFSLGHKLLGVH